MLTPSDSPSAPGEYAAVAVAGMNIQAPQELDAIAAATDAAVAVAGPGGPRQRQTEALLSGSDAPGVTAGSSGGGGEDWPGSIAPPGM